MFKGWPLLTLWAQRAIILHKVKTFTGYSPEFTRIVQKGIFQNGTFLLFSMSSQKPPLSLDTDLKHLVLAASTAAKAMPGLQTKYLILVNGKRLLCSLLLTL